MNKKYFYIIGGAIFLFLLILTLPKYFSKSENSFETKISSDIEKVEVIHFHGNHQCYSCILVGKYAEETINNFFSNELKSGKITFAHVNGELPENFGLVKKYGVRSASLWIGTYYKDGTFKAEENINVWYKINNKEDYANYLKSVIENKLLSKK